MRASLRVPVLPAKVVPSTAINVLLIGVEGAVVRAVALLNAENNVVPGKVRKIRLFFCYPGKITCFSA